MERLVKHVSDLGEAEYFVVRRAWEGDDADGDYVTRYRAFEAEEEAVQWAATRPVGDEDGAAASCQVYSLYALHCLGRWLRENFAQGQRHVLMVASDGG